MAPLRLICWEGYDTPSIVVPFEQRHGVEVQAQTLLSDAGTAEAIAAGSDRYDVLNINNAYVARYLYPRGLVMPLDTARFAAGARHHLPQFERLYRWTRAPDTGELIGICQRFGAFNLVVNTRAVSIAVAEDQGFALAADSANRGRFGILRYEDFNVFHLCIASGLNPFVPLDDAQERAFEATARAWFGAAALVTDDHHRLNRALKRREIDFYLSGGTYTASPARLDGHDEIHAVTPSSGPIDGRGGIVFVEITCRLRQPEPHPHGEDFLAYLVEPETAVRAALVDGTCNPVAQMGDRRVFDAFSAKHLNAIQWDTLEQDIARCADYDIVPNHASLRTRLRDVADAQ